MRHDTVGPIPCLNLPAPVKGLIACGKKISTCLDGNTKTPSPSPSINVLNALIANLEKSEGEMGGGLEKTAQRNADRVALVKALISERDYVRSVAHQQPTPAEAAAVITGAGMFVKQSGAVAKAPFEASQGPVTGTALLAALAVRGAVAYYWEVSTDQASWSSLPDTPQAHTLAKGLTAGTKYYFRFRALTRKNGTTDWSQTAWLIVV